MAVYAARFKLVSLGQKTLRLVPLYGAVLNTFRVRQSLGYLLLILKLLSDQRFNVDERRVILNN